MPRLINADAFAEELLGYIYERGQESGSYENKIEIGAMTYRDLAYEDGYDYALEEFWHNLEERPTVDAIPKEWIRKWARKMVAETDNFNWGTFTLIMLEDWEKENAEGDTE